MGTYKIEVDRSLCVGDGLCREEAPSTFELDGEDKVVVTDPDGDEPNYILKAARNCPLEAISLYDVDTGEQIWPLED